ncbi:MAG: rhodanese-like domain-containing protein, partial [Bacillota bacterium]
MKKVVVLVLAGVLIVAGSLLLTGCSSNNQTTEETKEVEETKEAGDSYIPISERGYANPESLISCEELNEIREQDNVKVVDNGHKAKFVLGHIPGAVNIEKGEMKAKAGMRISKERFEKLLSEYGISNEDTIVVYDRDGNKYASWFWWLAKLYGHEDI